MSDRLCKTCKWYDAFTSVCCNGNSEYWADFVDEYDVCPEWKQKALHEDEEAAQ